MANLDIPCTKYCNRKEHGDFIVSALTKRAVTDADLAAFLNYTCVLCGSSKDAYERTALHMAASCGRTNVCRWLVCQKQAKIDEKDAESGYTALHRSIFCGKIDTAVALIQLGANPKTLDANDLTPLDHALYDNLLPVGDVHSSFIYVWGSNTNYTLGPNQARDHPEVLGAFHKCYPLAEAKEIHLEKFHTVILARSGEAYSFGHGQGGRLGLGTEKTVLEPMELKFASNNNNNAAAKIKSCAIARDHCLFLTETSEVWSCGSNTHHTLGIVPPPAQLLAPRHVSKLKTPLEGVACGRHHSVAWNANAVYTWGLNGGQLGHDKTAEPTIALPKVVTCLSSPNRRIISVAASVGATAVATDRGDVYVLHEYQCRAIASKHLGVKSVSVYGGRLATPDERREELRVLALTEKGDVLVWQESDPQLCRCAFSLNRLLVVREARLNAGGLVLITRDREVFDGRFGARRRKAAAPQKKHFNHFLERDACVPVQLERVARLYGADSVTCDLEGHNFAAIHLNTSAMIARVPEIGPSTMRADFAKLMGASDVEPDVTFRVGGRAFPAHRFVVRAASEKLGGMRDDGGVVAIENVEPEIFRELLEYCYTGTCGVLREGPIAQDLLKFNRKKRKSEGINDPLRLTQEAAKRLGVSGLYDDLNQFEVRDAHVRLKPEKTHRGRTLRFHRKDAPELRDVRLKAAGGDGGHVDAHSCVLAARSEFFASMFSTRWSRTAEIELPSTVECVRLLVDYLYADQVDLEREDAERILALLVLADHVLLARLVEVCEFALSRLITLKNGLRLLAIADAYGAAQLKDACMEHACLNLALLLETRHLEQLDDELLADLTGFYARWNGKMRRRVVTPFGDAVDDATVAAAAARCRVRMDFDEIVRAERQKAHRRRNRARRASEAPPDPVERCAEATQSGDDAATPERMPPPPRIRSIRRAHETMSGARVEEDFVSLSLLSADAFPDLSASFGGPPPARTPKQRPGKMSRLSQKERKRLNSETPSAEAEPAAAPESPRNPWNVNFDAPAPKSATLGNILCEEKEQRKNLSRIRSKLLIYTQMEDKALEDLRKFYNVDNVFDEIIEVARVDYGQIAAPLWIQK